MRVKDWTKTLVLAALTVLAGCKRQTLGLGHTTGYVVGPTSDIHTFGAGGGSGDEEVAQLSPDVLNGSVLIATRLQDKRVKFCSGSLIAAEVPGDPYRVLTNHHCFAETDEEDKAKPEVLPEACTFTVAHFGFINGQTATSASAGCKAGSLRTNFDGDLAVFTLDHNPPEKFKPLQLWDGEDGAAGRAAAIVHYPDTEENMASPPEGGAQLPTAAVTLNDCQVLGLFPVSEWDLDRTLPFSLRHTCDLIHGSSGSALIDVKTSKILGVNWGGIKISYDDGDRTDNVATRASYVQAFLTFKQDALIQAADTKRQQNSLAATKKEDDGLGAKGDNLKKTFKKSCGVVSAEAGTGTSPWVVFLLLGLGLFLPFTVSGRRLGE